MKYLTPLFLISLLFVSGCARIDSEMACADNMNKGIDNQIALGLLPANVKTNQILVSTVPSCVGLVQAGGTSNFRALLLAVTSSVKIGYYSYNGVCENDSRCISQSDFDKEVSELLVNPKLMTPPLR